VLIYSSVLIYSGYPRSPDVSVRFRGVAVGHSASQRQRLSGEDVMARVPGGSPALSTVLLSLASAHHQGKIVDCYVQMRITR
jgi:hypothetical protein